MGNSLCNMICLSLWDRRLTKFFYGDVTHAQVLLRSTYSKKVSVDAHV